MKTPVLYIVIPCYNEAKTINEKAPYSLEVLLKNAREEISHPNAARYLLYMVLKALEEKIWPYIEGCAIFLEKTLEEFDGKWLVSRSASPVNKNAARTLRTFVLFKSG